MVGMKATGMAITLRGVILDTGETVIIRVFMPRDIGDAIRVPILTMRHIITRMTQISASILTITGTTGIGIGICRTDIRIEIRVVRT